MRKAVKSAILNTLLLSYTLLPEVFSQQFAANNAAAYPNTYYQGNIYGNNAATKGYSNSNTASYINSPVHGQYWTGHSQTYPQYTPQQYGAYPTGYGYAQNGGYYPQQYAQSYAQYGQASYGNYPGFDAHYWTGNYYPQPVPVYHHQVPVYHQGVPMYPVYHGQQNYYGHPSYYGHQNQYYYGRNPYYKRRSGKGFFGGKGNSVAKTLLGAAVVGVVAGTVAKKG